MLSARIKNKSKGFVPDLITGWGNPKLKAELVTQALEKGIDLQSPILQWYAAKELTKSMNSTQIYQLQGAINTVRNDLVPMRKLNSEFQRVGFTPVNKIILGASRCWVAKEIFGSWEHPKTILARYYINNFAPLWFKKFYFANSERIAKFINNKPLLKIIIRPLFEIFAYLGNIKSEVIYGNLRPV